MNENKNQTQQIPQQPEKFPQYGGQPPQYQPQRFKPKKKKKWPIVLAVILAVAVIGGIGSTMNGGGDVPVNSESSAISSAPKSSALSSESSAVSSLSESEPSESSSAPASSQEGATQAPSGSVEQLNALGTAENYLDFTSFSREGLIDQLEYEGYTTEDATWAVDNVGADWNEQALQSAKDYLDYTAFSYSGLIGQLEYEGFTTEQATAAPIGWNKRH